MAPVTNGRLIFNKIPTGLPEPGKTTVYDTSKTIDLENEPLNGGVLIKTLALSADPYMRVRMRPADVESYMPPFIIGQPIASGGIGKVIRSEHEGFKVGDYVSGVLDHAHYSIPNIDGPFGVKVFKPEFGLKPSLYLGAAGMPAQTAFYGWKEYADAKPGETVFVSGGAGPVGSMVIQLAKEEGLKVIASAGSDEKVQFCKDVGADVAFNYKTVSTEDILKKEGPLHVYWDNVGGTTLDAALENAATNARFIECGAISTYNSKDGVVMKNIDQIYARCIKLYGFLVVHLAPKWQKEFYEVIPKKIASGDFKYKEDITRGLENAGEALREVQTGKNHGKKVIIVSDD
ncbi:NAD(P)-binding protein [Gymnopus androsaceus JB14]|uniref:NAD(P)-binding protein n=1 Tax=Gymnopus androsaceus JB14 TaxID=1447944 RepID=A0A6A4I697_9AGAR|nr:NAD(P)-binding protein [Gymnopus androsaceus JB14]